MLCGHRFVIEWLSDAINACSLVGRVFDLSVFDSTKIWLSLF